MTKPGLEANPPVVSDGSVAAPLSQKTGPHAEVVPVLSSPPGTDYKAAFTRETPSNSNVPPLEVATAAAQPTQSAAEVTVLDRNKSPKELSKPGGAIVDRTVSGSDVTSESNRPQEVNENTKPKISVAMQDLSEPQTEKPNFVVKSDGTVEMHSDPEAGNSKNVSVQIERSPGQLNPTDAQQKSAEELVRYVSERLKQKYPAESKQGVELDDKDGVVPKEAEKASNLVPPADQQKLTPQTRESMQEVNRFNGSGGVDMPHAATERMGSFNTRDVPRQAGESEKQAWVKESWAGLFKPDSDKPYETLRKSPQGDYRFGRYGMSGDQLLSFLESLGDPPNEALIEALIKKGKLPKDFAEKLKNPKFLSGLKDAAQKMKSGGDVSNTELAQMLPKEAQESIASMLVDQMSANSKVGGQPGAISAALMSGKAPQQVSEADLSSPEGQQLASAGQKLYDIASKRSGDQNQGGVGEIPTGERAELISKALRLAGEEVNEANLRAVNTIVEKESSWNAKAKNNWDWNAQQGHPSEGLMQTIPTTFAAHALPGYNSDITDPLSNLIAGIRYSKSRYGSVQNVPGLVAMANNGGYVGY
jgi:hypothetical protein